MDSPEATDRDPHPYEDSVVPPDIDTCRTYAERALDDIDQLRGAIGNDAKLDHARFAAKIAFQKVSDALHEITVYAERHRE